ncbi:MAG TPA: hypothetical protein VMG35_01605, partial [Bryobacteraceae bacterium]|nr:hypothetical protein [Bryobacteraceae bacterium]
LEVSRGGLYRALARMAHRAEPTYNGLLESARQAPVNGMDETGWKVGGRLQWLLRRAGDVQRFKMRTTRFRGASRVLLGRQDFGP